MSTETSVMSSPAKKPKLSTSTKSERQHVMVSEGQGELARESHVSPHPDLHVWRQCVRHWFPRLFTRTYFVPPVYMNRLQHQPVKFAGLHIDVPQIPVVTAAPGASSVLHKSTVREDLSQQHVLHCVRKLAESQREPMFVISQLRFGDFLGNPCYAAAASTFPRPVDLKKEQKDRGDFDMLFLHRQYGIVVAELKAVGDNFAGLSLTERDEDELVAIKVQQAVKQLEKAGDVLKHLVSDQQRPPRVLKTVMLPNVTRSQLRRILLSSLPAAKEHSSQLVRDLCKCLGTEDVDEAVDMCVLADHLSDRNTPWEVTADVIKGFGQWWDKRVSRNGPDPAMTDDVYEDLVARFCGPATTVRLPWVTQPPMHFIREGDGVAVASSRFTSVVLSQHQLDVLNMDLPLVFLCGPPGTGKTVLLVVRATDWLRRGFDVHVVSTWLESLAASHLIVHQLQQSAGHSGRRVHLHSFDFSSGKSQVESAVKCLEEAASQGPLYVVVDEANAGSLFTDFCDEICTRVSQLRLWVASAGHSHTPARLTEFPMTEPLRTPPVVTREVEKSGFIREWKTILGYTPSPTPPPCDGPPLRVLYHRGQGHNEGRPPPECEQCGMDVAEVLRELHVNVPGDGDSGTSTHPPPLTFRDVFVLSWNTSLYDEDTDSTGNEVRPACGIVRGLRKSGIPVRVLCLEDEDALREVATMSGRDAVVAAGPACVRGLERKIVVWMQTERTGMGDESWGRLHALSRSTAQMIRIIWPPGQSRVSPV